MAQENAFALVLRASDFAAQKHASQMRKDGKTPYVNHVIGVAHILTSLGGVDDPDVLAAALLHDTVEDTDTTFEELESVFGPIITGLVRECSDDKTLPKAERKRLQIEHAASASHKAKLIKLADKLYNVRDLENSRPIGWSEERIQEYFDWAHKVISQIRGTNTNIERELDLIFARNGHG